MPQTKTTKTRTAAPKAPYTGTTATTPAPTATNGATTRPPMTLVTEATPQRIMTDLNGDVLAVFWLTETTMLLVMAARDRLGLTRELTDKFKKYWLNITNATLTRAEGFVGTILWVHGKKEQLTRFEAEIQEIRTRVRETGRTITPKMTYDLKVVAVTDRPGIVGDVSTLMEACKLNIVKLAVRTCTPLGTDVNLLDGTTEEDVTNRIGVTHIRFEAPTPEDVDDFRTRLTTLDGYDTWDVRLEPTETPTTTTTRGTKLVEMN